MKLATGYGWSGWKTARTRVRMWLVLAILAALLLASSASAAPLGGNKGGCASYWRGVACTVKKAGRGWAFGDCAFGMSFSGLTPGQTLTKETVVSVSGCMDQTGNLYNAGGKYPLVVTRR